MLHDTVFGPYNLLEIWDHSLILLFIDDPSTCCHSGKVRIFADDTTIFFYSDNIDNIIEIASIIMTQLSSWCNAN